MMSKSYGGAKHRDATTQLYRITVYCCSLSKSLSPQRPRRTQSQIGFILCVLCVLAVRGFWTATSPRLAVSARIEVWKLSLEPAHEASVRPVSVDARVGRYPPRPAGRREARPRDDCEDPRRGAEAIPGHGSHQLAERRLRAAADWRARHQTGRRLDARRSSPSGASPIPTSRHFRLARAGRSCGSARISSNRKSSRSSAFQARGPRARTASSSPKSPACRSKTTRTFRSTAAR